ncbi:hypothetical protein [Delftia acidovorans]|uniref:hypothetical protein n=1 Tax=Delftia acidovorans TaxID=80866 RepID=UPI0030ECF179
MKEGDILVSSACSFTSWGIRLFTISRFSHAAFAISDKEVIEATPNGVLTVSINSFIKKNNRVLLLERPEKLTPQQSYFLREHLNCIEGLQYNLKRGINSGVNYFGLVFWVFSLMVGIFFLLYKGEFLYLGIFVTAMLVPLVLLFISANPVRANKIFRMLGVPEKWLTNLNEHFCSQLVFDLDEKINGGLSKRWRKLIEPRPKDIKMLAIKMKFNPVIIKPKRH